MFMKYLRARIAPPWLQGLVLLPAVVAALSGCASGRLDKSSAASNPPAPITLPPPVTAAGAASPSVVPAATVAAAAPTSAATPGLPAFAQIIKDARKVDGPLTAWQKDEKVWLELGPEHWGTPYLLSPKLRTGIGEGYLVGGLMTNTFGASRGQIVEFVRVHNQVRLVARNQMAVAPFGTPQARAVEAAGASMINTGIGWHEARIPTIATMVPRDGSLPAGCGLARRRRRLDAYANGFAGIDQAGRMVDSR